MASPSHRPDPRRKRLPGSVRAGRRTWTMVVACSGVALVIASMTALNTALGDIAVATSATQSQLTWIVDGYSVLACLLLPAGAIGDRYGRRGAFLIGLATFSDRVFSVDGVHQSCAAHRGPRCRRRRSGVHHARHPVAVDGHPSRGRTCEGHRHLGRRRWVWRR